MLNFTSMRINLPGSKIHCGGRASTRQGHSRYWLKVDDDNLLGIVSPHDDVKKA
jgi:hypothetical protein